MAPKYPDNFKPTDEWQSVRLVPNEAPKLVSSQYGANWLYKVLAWGDKRGWFVSPKGHGLLKEASKHQSLYNDFRVRTYKGKLIAVQVGNLELEEEHFDEDMTPFVVGAHAAPSGNGQSAPPEQGEAATTAPATNFPGLLQECLAQAGAVLLSETGHRITHELIGHPPDWDTMYKLAFTLYASRTGAGESAPRNAERYNLKPHREPEEEPHV